MPEAGIGPDLVTALKRTAGAPGPGLRIPVGRPPAALLRPVATLEDRLSADDVRLLTEWRNRFAGAFLTEFEATEARTARWLSGQVGPSAGKILFMLDDLDGRTFGYMGLDYIDWDRGYGEADAIVRGADAPKGLMTRALQTLLAWATGQLGLRTLGVRVLSDNPALAFYEKLGFCENRRVPLRRESGEDAVRWIQDPDSRDAVRQLVFMTYEAEQRRSA